MRVYIYADEEQEKEIRRKSLKPGVELYFATGFPLQKDIEIYDVFFILGKYDLSDISRFNQKPVIINSVTEKLTDYHLPQNIARINGWPGFLHREVWEIAGFNQEEFQLAFDKMGWEIIFVKDEPGMVAARVVSMIINEAFYALKENISTVTEIDIAMKSGTNYPYGPFEWAGKIGLENIYDLLSKLSEKDKRCFPSFRRDEVIMI